MIAPQAPAWAQPVAASHLHKPLMIIRFNQQRVFYQKPLYNTLSRAVKAAPSVRFSLVSYVPRTGDSQMNQRWLQSANAHTQEVVAQMRQMGVPAAQIAINNELDPSLKYDELHIFVR